MAHDAARTYYVIGGYVHFLDPARASPGAQTREISAVLYVQGNRCDTIEADSAQDLFESRYFNEISQPALQQLADDLAARLVKAFGGPDRLRQELRIQHVDQTRLPLELSTAFAPYFPAQSGTVEQAMTAPPRVLQVPVLGLRYEADKVHFEPLPGAVASLCMSVLKHKYTDRWGFVFAKADVGVRTYYIIGGYYEDLQPEPGHWMSQPDEHGSFMYIEGTGCRMPEFADEAFETPDVRESPPPVLRRLADDLAARLVKAYGGKDQLREELRSQHMERAQLTPELQAAFAPYFDQ
jgi:hypothetical protein